MTTTTIRLADVCCCGGLGADGYAAVLGAGAVTGYDIHPQPDYPYPFVQADALALLDRQHPGHTPQLEEADVIHTSFPCQALTTAGHLRTAQGGVSKYPDLLTPGLALLREQWNDRPWIAENVDDNQGKVRAIMAPRDGESLVMLCGSMFGLQVQRHRLFLANFPLRQPAPVPHPVNPKTGKPRASKYRDLGCNHDTFPLDPVTGKPRPWGVWHVAGDSVPDGGRTARDAEHAREVMGSHRLLPWNTVKEGFPPQFTSWIAADLIAHLVERADWFA